MSFSIFIVGKPDAIKFRPGNWRTARPPETVDPTAAAEDGYTSRCSGVGQPRSRLTLFTTSVTTPQSGTLSRR